ncbi:PaaI family thioesterase [Pontibacter silvestris]|uniref:PaaI family thioesterase n=1 Tax=Pontibacter silvestris TaxID=2305183 RepID=A0ABW4WWK2_9BACT|nr:PaaI family thioesterase [Pontibacter silvestris]MCC9136900.1 PaaI family thioesterase [Pontibacter silvestris]
MENKTTDFATSVRKKFESQGYTKLLGFNVTSISDGEVEIELHLNKSHMQHHGSAHGGLIASMADTVAGFAAISVVPEDHYVVTAEIKVSYFSPGIGDKLVAKGYVIKRGRKLNFCEAEIYAVKGDEDPKLIAKASATMATITPK